MPPSASNQTDPALTRAYAIAAIRAHRITDNELQQLSDSEVLEVLAVMENEHAVSFSDWHAGLYGTLQAPPASPEMQQQARGGYTVAKTGIPSDASPALDVAIPKSVVDTPDKLAHCLMSSMQARPIYRTPGMLPAPEIPDPATVKPTKVMIEVEGG